MSEFHFEQKIIHRLILQSPFIKDLGLLNGKMGIALFFFEFGKSLNCDVYTDFGGELLDDIWEQVHSELPLTFDSGLSGIGWGVEYLFQRDFLEGDSSVICEEIDKMIMQINLLKLDDHSFETGLGGLLYYVSARMQGAYLRNDPQPFDYDYLNDLSQLLPYFDIDNPTLFYSRYPVAWSAFLKRVLVTESTYLSLPLSLKGGLSGYLLNKIQPL